MKKFYLISFVILTFIGCEKDDSHIYRQLNEFEKTVIPFIEVETVEFTNELSEFIAVNVTARDFKTSNTQSGNGPVYELEYVKNDFMFESREEEFIIQISKTQDDNTQFSIFLNRMDDFTGVIGSQCENAEFIDLESQFTDTIVNGFSYTNVFKFELCEDDIFDDEFNIVQIIYSIENGIEFIEYDDGTFLKQITE